tara:strand:+ start:73 stop:303 length:231 start_codon:yes stop_codon:yes gene_type:complete
LHGDAMVASLLVIDAMNGFFSKRNSLQESNKTNEKKQMKVINKWNEGGVHGCLQEVLQRSHQTAKHPTWLSYRELL